MEINIGVLVKHDLTPDDYAYLFCIVERVSIPFRVRVDKEKLEKEGWIKLVENGVIAREQAKRLFVNEDWEFKEKEEEQESPLEALTEQYRALFPSGTKLAGRALIGSRIGCLKKMEKFKKNTHYSDKIILGATKVYLTEFYKNKQEWRYAMNADYFIEKNGGSQLESYCEMLTKGAVQAVENMNEAGGEWSDDI